MHPNKKILTIIVFVVVLVVAGIGVMLVGQQSESPLTPTPIPEEEQVACTMDAKICPDGSYVGRQGPRCEFAACPGANTSTDSAGAIESNTTPKPW